MRVQFRLPRFHGGRRGRWRARRTRRRASRIVSLATMAHGLQGGAADGKGGRVGLSVDGIPRASGKPYRPEVGVVLTFVESHGVGPLYSHLAVESLHHRPRGGDVRTRPEWLHIIRRLAPPKG